MKRFILQLTLSLATVVALTAAAPARACDCGECPKNKAAVTESKAAPGEKAQKKAQKPADKATPAAPAAPAPDAKKAEGTAKCECEKGGKGCVCKKGECKCGNCGAETKSA